MRKRQRGRTRRKVAKDSGPGGRKAGKESRPGDLRAKGSGSCGRARCAAYPRSSGGARGVDAGIANRASLMPAGVHLGEEKVVSPSGTVVVLRKRASGYSFWLPTISPGATPAYYGGLPTISSARRLLPTIPPKTIPAPYGGPRLFSPV